MNKTIIGIIALVVVVLGAWALWGGDGKKAMEVDDAMTAPENQDAMMKEDAGTEPENGTMMEDVAPSGDAMMDQQAGVDTMMPEKTDAMMATGGTYEAYDASKLALAKTGKVVLFFRASWCPTCRALDGDIRSHLGDIPKDVTILDVDYDTATDLKAKYGITTQHTLVRVDADGKELAKWVGSPSLQDVVSRLN